MKQAAPLKPEIRTIAAGEFKAKCLKLMDEAGEMQQKIGVTKRGRLVGHWVPLPLEEKPFYSVVGRSPGIKILGDIISPLSQEWTLPEFSWEPEIKASKKEKKKK